MKGEVWLRAETPAIVRATIIEKPVVAAKLLKRAKSPVIVVGHEAAEGDGSGSWTRLPGSLMRPGHPLLQPEGFPGIREEGHPGVHRPFSDGSGRPPPGPGLAAGP